VFFLSNVPLENNSDVTINNVNTEVNIESSTSVERSTSISETIKPEDFTTEISLRVSSEVSSKGMDKNNSFDMVFKNIIETSSDPTDLGHQGSAGLFCHGNLSFSYATEADASLNIFGSESTLHHEEIEIYI